MVRTVATAVRTGGAKSTKGAATMGSGGGSTSSAKSRRTYIGGNKLINRPIPNWQKPISNFFGRNENIVIQPTSFENEEDEDLVTVLEPPDWQKPVTEFLTGEGSSQKYKCESNDSNLEQMEEDMKGDSETAELKHNSNDIHRSDEEPCSSGGSNKRQIHDMNQDESSSEDDENPSKRSRPCINYKMLEEYENS